MASFARTARAQRGVTLIEIILVIAIVAAAAVSIFVFAKKARVTAAVETEQRQVQDIVRTVEGLFATQPNFAALGTNGRDGAEYLTTHAARAGLSLTQDGEGKPSLHTGLGGGGGTLTIASTQVDFPAMPGQPNNAFVLTYEGLMSSECTRLVTSTASFTTKTHVAPVGTASSEHSLIAERGDIDPDKTKLATACSVQNGVAPSVRLYFAPARAITSLARPSAPPNARCAPVHETQQIACPAGQVGTITQERDGACTGANNALVYTGWATTDNTCQTPSAPSIVVTPPTAPDSCTTTSFTNVVVCPAGQTGLIMQTRQLESCSGTYTPWATYSNTCKPIDTPTCTTSAQTQTLACSAGMTGTIDQIRYSTCTSPTAAPTWPSIWDTLSNTCRGIATCQPQRESGPVPCPAGQYGAWTGERERYRRCVNATTQAGWDPWSTLTPNSGCASCPADTFETTTRWATESTSCPAGQVGTHSWEVEQVSTRTTSYNCSAGTTTLPSPSVSSWGAWVNTGATRNEIYSCAPATCSGASSDSQWLSTSGTCPAGQSGTYTWEYEQTRSRTCNAGVWSDWGGWTSTGATRNVVNTCSPSTCSGPSSDSQWLGTSGACPSGQTGTHTWEFEQTRSRTCNSGTWGAWGGWTNTGAKRNEVNTCQDPNGSWYMVSSGADPESSCTGSASWHYSVYLNGNGQTCTADANGNRTCYGTPPSVDLSGTCTPGDEYSKDSCDGNPMGGVLSYENWRCF